MRVRVGVVGCGQWGQNHVRTLSAIGALGLVADRDPDKTRALAEQHGVLGSTPDEAVASPAIDALVLALPPHLHGSFARRAVAAGKDVLVEKPIALDPVDAEATAQAARAHGRILMVGHVLRFHPAFQRLAALVAEGRIGALRHVAATRLGLGRFLGMDAVWDLAPHDLSLVLKLAGGAPDTVEVQRRTVLSNATDAADVALRFPNGVTAAIHLSRVSPYRDRRLAAIGTAGMLVFDDGAPAEGKLVFHAHRVEPAADGAFSFHHAEAEAVSFEPGQPLERELRHFIACVETRAEPETGAAEAVEVVRLLARLSPLAG